jgi:hypothetical protein
VYSTIVTFREKELVFPITVVAELKAIVAIIKFLKKSALDFTGKKKVL